MKKFLIAVFLLALFVLPMQAQAAMKLVDTGAASIMNAYFNNSPAPGNLSLKLFCTNTTPSDSDTVSTYTECSGGGYSAITLTNGSWTESNVGGIEQVAYAQQTFTFTGALTTNGTIYGYYVVNAAGTILIWAEATSTFTPANNGDTFKVTPKFQLSYGTPQ